MGREPVDEAPPSRWFQYGLAFVALALALAPYVHNVAKNDAGRRRANAACTRIRAGLEARDAQLAPVARLAFGEDTDLVLSHMRSGIERTCDTVDHQLEWWRWNLGRELSIPPASDQERASVDQALERGTERCPRAYAELLLRLPAGAQLTGEERARIARGVCAPLAELLEQPIEPEPMSVHEWVEWLELHATMLESEPG